MNVYTIKNWRTGDIVEIKAIYCEVTKQNQFEFGALEKVFVHGEDTPKIENKIVEKLYHIYNWDLINIEYGV